MTDQYDTIEKTVPTFYFIGVTTGQSSIMKVFPHWTKALGLPDVVMEGVDIALNADPEVYRQAVAQIKYDPNSLGALVTTHKLNLLEAARDKFDFLDNNAQVTAEVSSISKRGDRLEGHAKDPITAGLSLEAILGKGYFGKTGGHVFCLGAGGAATAMCVYFVNQLDAADRPERVVLVDVAQKRLDHLKEVLNGSEKGITFDFVLSDGAEHNDRLLAELPAKSVVINATGMGKDLPGSPLTDAAVFPEDGIVWELNYRGERLFMQQAMAQQEVRHLHVEDGWTYFVQGWSQVIAQVYGVEVTPEKFEELSQIAKDVRSRS